MGLPTVRASLAAASLIALSACASPERTVHELPVVITPEVLSSDHLSRQNLRGLFARATALVARRSGTSLEGLTLHIVDDADIDVEVRQETRRLVEAQFGETGYADFFVKRVMGVQTGTYLALYSARRNAVLVSDSMLQRFVGKIEKPALAHNAVLALLIHEAVHAADDRRHDIDRVRTLDFRAAFAQSAVFEGHAQWQARQLCAQAGCLDGLKELDRFMFGDGSPNQRAQSSAAASRNVIEYAYVEGERFIDALASRSDGKAALDTLLSAPPVDPIQILSPSSWPDNQREARNRYLLHSVEAVDHPWTNSGYQLIQTSPLKGVNLRSDPNRRAAAVDGFTRLLTAMAAIEVHAMDAEDAPPVDMTILQSESDETALLFARTLHANTIAHRGTNTLEPLEFGDTMLLRTSRRNSPTSRYKRADTVIGVNGRHIIQLAAADTDAQMLEDFARAALEKLAAGQ